MDSNKVEIKFTPTLSPFCSNGESAAAGSTEPRFHDLNNPSMANTVNIPRITSRISKNLLLQRKFQKRLQTLSLTPGAQA